MHDIKSIRDNPSAFDAGLGRRHLAPMSAEILAIDAGRRSVQTEMQELQAKRNDVSKKIGGIKQQGRDAEPLMQEVARLKERLTELDISEKADAQKLRHKLAALPNVPAPDVPEGKDENDNKELRTFGTIKSISKPKQHFELGEALGLMDFEAASKLSGARFTVLKGGLARLERALGDFMLDTLTEQFGYMEISPPLLVREEMMFGTAQMPKFEEDQFWTVKGDFFADETFGDEKLERLKKERLGMIPTAEVPLTNLVNDIIVEREKLPLRMTARTPCFRAEAGAAGRDTRGMLRQHQFYKVEMVSVTASDQSDAEHERMTEAAETVLKKLDLPFRTIVLCAGDMGFAAKKTYDIEVFMPGQDTYREISSCSNCGDFQARRMNARTRQMGDKNTEFLHTLNGSGVAVGRCLIAVMENYQQPDGSIAVPDVLRDYMGGLEKIG